MIFNARHRFPAELVDHHGAMLTALMANVHRTEDHPAFELADFLTLKPVPVVEKAPAKSEPSRPAMTEGRRIQAFLRAGR